MNTPLIEPLEARIAPATFSISAPDPLQEGDSGTKELLFMVTLTDAITSDTTVDFTTVNGVVAATQATVSDGDYELKTGTLTFKPGEATEQLIHVVVKGDTKLEVNELFSVKLSAPSNGATLGVDSATGTIGNDDPIPKVSIADFTIVEGDAGTKTATYTLTLSNASSTSSSVRVSTADVTATAGSDYVAVSNALITFLPNTTTISRTVTINGDTTAEMDETFKVILSSPSGAELGTSEAIGTITNDEPILTIDSGSLSVVTTEGDSGSKSMNFTVKLSKASTEAVSVTVATTAGSATAGTDFTAVSQVFTFNPGDPLTKTFSVPILGDLSDEADETFSVDLSSPNSNAVLGSATHAVGTILNDEIQILASDVAIQETGGDTTLTFNVTLSKAANHDVTVAFTTQDGTAISSGTGKDFDLNSGTLTFAPGQTTLPVSIVVHGDSIGELDENFLLKLASPTGALLARDSVKGTILNDETTLSISDVQVLEGNAGGVTEAVFTVTLANRPTTGNVTVDFATADGTATVAGTDYVSNAGSLTFAPDGELTQTVKVLINGDTTTEQNEAFSVVLSGESSNVTLAKNTGIGTISNDDGPAFTISDVTVTEGDFGTSNAVFLVRLLNSPSQVLTVDVTTEAGTASTSDFTPFSATKTLTFAVGQTQQVVTVPIVGDLIQEGSENFFVKLSNAKGTTPTTPNTAAPIVTIAKDTGIGTILDNNDPSVTVRVGDVTLAEGDNGTTIYSFQVSANPQNGGTLTETVTVNFATVDGTAISSGDHKDFTAKTGTLVFAPGGDLTQTVSISVNADARLENNEQFFLNIVSAVNAGIADGQGVGTITNDDSVKISIGDASITEGNSATSNMNFTVTLEGTSDVPVSVRADTVDGTALGSVTGALNDFTKLTNQPITFAPGETSKTVSVAIVGDTVQEAATTEVFTVKLSAATPNGVTLQNDAGTGTITDNDPRTLSVSNVVLLEGNAGTVEASFTVTLSATSSQDVTFNYATADITATAGQDYVVPQQTTGTITAGQTTTVVKVLVNGDTTSEVNERFLLNLVSSPNAIISATAGSGTATIVDDEAGGARLQLVPVNGSDFSVDENGFAEFVVERTGDASRAVSVQYETLDGTAQSEGTFTDFVAKTGTISIAANAVRSSETIRIKIIDDKNFENDETFSIRLFNPGNAAVLDEVGNVGAEGATDVTILADGDVAPKLTIADLRIDEGAADTTKDVVFKVRLVDVNGNLASNEKQVVTVRGATESGSDPATSANSARGVQTLLQDYEATTSGGNLITFNKGAAEGDFTVKVNGDARDELDEEFFRVVLSAASGAEVLRSEAIGTIVDDDAAPTLTFSGPSTAPTEGDGGLTTVSYTVTLSEISERPVSVLVTTNDILAVSTGDHADFQSLTNFVASYEPGTQSKTFGFSVKVKGDTVNEADETFGVTLSSPVNAKIVGGTLSATTTIKNDDPSPVILVGDASVIEGNSGTSELVFTVSLTGASEKTVEVKYSTQAGTTTATGPLADFIAKSGTLTFEPGELQKEVRVTVIGDTYKEKSETLTLQLNSGSAVNGTVLDSASFGTGTILTDGDSTVAIAIRDAFAVEGNSGVSQMSFTVELSDSIASATTFTGVATSGTAIKGRPSSDGTSVIGGDFATGGDGSVTIAANNTSATFTVFLAGDSAFEATEGFLVSLRNVLNVGGENVSIVGGAARGTIFNDDLRRVNNQTIQFVDVDGDLATVHLSKGFLNTSNLSFSTPNAVGGRQLQVISLIGNNAQYQNANLSVTAVKQPGFEGDANGVRGDGLVNVGAIYAAVAQPGILQFVNGIDLGNITIDGDLGKIHVGDTAATSAVKNLVVRSMGKLGTTTQPAATQTTTPDLISLVLGPINSLHVLGDFQSTLQIVGAQFGIVRNLQIDGSLLGGSTSNSGEIFFTGRIDSAKIGRIVGGEGGTSGALVGASSTNARIVNLQVIGDVRGGAGASSGVVSAPVIGTVRVGAVIGGVGATSGDVLAGSLDSAVVVRNIIGGDGKESGQIFANGVLGSVRVFGEVRGGKGESSGLIGSTVRIGTAYVFGSILGGDGASSGGVQVDGALSQIRTGALVGGVGSDSGTIRAGGNIQKLTIDGNVKGGIGSGSGGVDVSGRLLSGFVGGAVIGGDSTATTALLKSGFVTAHRIQNLTVNGDLMAGTDGGAGIALSGTIRSETTIGSLTIRGNVTGSENVAAIISALGDTSGAAIQTLTIGGQATFAEILGGYSANATTSKPRGVATNSDAQIGTVKIVGDVKSTSIVVGVDAGPDGLFGTTDDFAIGGTGTTNAAGAVSKIASIIINGNVLAGTRSSGIEAQYLQALTVRGSAFPLTAGAGSSGDGAPGREVVADSKIFVFEVPVV